MKVYSVKTSRLYFWRQSEKKRRDGDTRWMRFLSNCNSFFFKSFVFIFFYCLPLAVTALPYTTMLTKLSTEGHPPAKKLVSGNQHGRLALLTSRTVGSNHELNAKHDGAAGERNSVAAFATGTVVGLHPSLILHHQQQQQQHALPPPPLRSKVKTSNGHLIPYRPQQVAHHSVKSRGPFQLLTELLIKINHHLSSFIIKYPTSQQQKRPFRSQNQ